VVRFKDKAEAWQVSVSQTFIALNTSVYDTRDDFCARFDEVVTAVADVSSPVVFDRVGIRYINRFTGEDLAALGELVRDPFLGLTSVAMAPVELKQTITQTILSFGETEIGARWGLLPPGMILDPSLEPVAAASWILDVDVYQERKGDFEAGEIGQQVRRYADAAYRFFRLAATDELLRSAGGHA
jgi:uncharacterized protein (TIGR04255 family)